MEARNRGRKAEPSQDELEFIFDCMRRGLEPKEILWEMEDTEFPSRGREFISRKRKYFGAAKKVLEKHTESRQEPWLVEAGIAHRRDLLRLAKRFAERLEQIRGLPVEHEMDSHVLFLSEYAYNRIPALKFDNIDDRVENVRLEVEDDPLFEGLRHHLVDDDLWKAYHEMKQLIANCIQLEGTLADDWAAIWNPPKGRLGKIFSKLKKRDLVQEEKLVRLHNQNAQLKREIEILKGGAVEPLKVQDFPFQVQPELRSEIMRLCTTVHESLRKACVKRAFPGQCPYCPE